MGSPSAWTPVPDASAWKPVGGAPPPATTGSSVLDGIAGVGAGAANTALDVYHLIRKIPGADKVLPDEAEFRQAVKDATPDNTPSHVGQFLEHAGEFIVPAGEVGRLTAGAKLGTRMAAQGVTAGAVRAAQGGSPGQIVDTAALGAAGPALGDAAGAVVSGAGNLIKNNPGIAKIIPDVVGMVSPRAGNVLRVAGKVVGATLPEKVAAVAETAEKDASLLDDLSTALTGKGFKAQTLETQQYIRDLAAKGQVKPPISNPAPQPTPQAPAQPSAPAQQQAAPAAPTPQAPVNTFVPGGPVRPPLAQAPPVAAAPVAPAEIPANATPQQLGTFPAKQAADWLAKRNGVAGPYDTAAGNELVPDKARSLSIAEQLRDEMLKTGNASPENLEDPLKSGLRDMMREIPQGAHKSVADANYAGNQEPATAGAVYEAAARADKANKLADALHKGGIPSADAARMDPDHWEMLSKGLGVKTPSKASIGEALFRLQRLEAAKPTGGIQ